ncbi:uncharacterized protein LOC143296607 [Babylonia areolata]|uniref:uncharacterized protein LOC143296607 n=1 Tax=Babylonia areolata TaxID=304850 RepID=UPI003FD02374
MLPLIFKRKKTAEFLRQNSAEWGNDRKKDGHRTRTLEDNMYGTVATSPTRSVDSDSGSGSSPGFCVTSSSSIGGAGVGGGGGGGIGGLVMGLQQGGAGGGGVGGEGGGGVGGGGGGYLSTGGRYYHDYPAAGRGGHPPRRSPSPVGSGEWALRECEVHTTWLNDLRKRQGQSPIRDLRTAVADGITVVQLTQTLTNSEVASVEQDRQLSRPQALVNLDRCLAHLAACGVDVIGIQANDLVEGDLKSTLLLLTQIRRRYDTGQSGQSRGDAGDKVGKGGAASRWTAAAGGRGGGGERGSGHPHRPTPDMPGRVDTSVNHRTDAANVQMRRGLASREEERMIPGVMTSEDHGGIVTSTQPSQQQQHRHHGDTAGDNRRHHYQPTNHSHPSSSSATSSYPSSQHASAPPTSGSASAPRPTPAPKPAVTSERPPAQLGVAWAAGSTHKGRQAMDNGVSGGGGGGAGGGASFSMEDRLRQLMLDSQQQQQPPRPLQYDDGELLLPPPPSRDFGDGVTLGGVTVDHSGTDGGPRPSPQTPDLSHSSRDQGYVPSRPSERRPGPRAEAMLHRDVTNQLSDSYRRHSATSSGGQYTNYAYVSESMSPPVYSDTQSQRSTSSSVQKASDLRSAWTKLYGAGTAAPSTSASGPTSASDWRSPPSRHDVVTASGLASGFRDGGGGAHEEFLLQDRSHNTINTPTSTTTTAHNAAHPPIPFHSTQHQHQHQHHQQHPPRPLTGDDPAPYPPPAYPHTRESPMGQSSSTNTTQGPTSDSSYRSSHSGQTTLMNASFRPPDGAGAERVGRVVGKEGEEEEEEEEDMEVRTLGPSSKYPEMTDGRPASARLTPQTGKPFGLRDMFPARSVNDVTRNSPTRGSPRDLHLSNPARASASGRDFLPPKSPKANGATSRGFGAGRLNPAFSGDLGEIEGMCDV